MVAADCEGTSVSGRRRCGAEQLSAFGRPRGTRTPLQPWRKWSRTTQASCSPLLGHRWSNQVAPPEDTGGLQAAHIWSSRRPKAVRVKGHATSTEVFEACATQWQMVVRDLADRVWSRHTQSTHEVQSNGGLCSRLGPPSSMLVG